MGDLITAVLAVLALGGGAVLAFRHDRRTARARARLAHAPWEVGELVENGRTVVYVHRPGSAEARIVIDTIPGLALVEWRERLLDARAQAEERAAILNAGH